MPDDLKQAVMALGQALRRYHNIVRKPAKDFSSFLDVPEEDRAIVDLVPPEKQRDAACYTTIKRVRERYRDLAHAAGLEPEEWPW